MPPTLPMVLNEWVGDNALGEKSGNSHTNTVYAGSLSILRAMEVADKHRQVVVLRDGPRMDCTQDLIGSLVRRQIARPHEHRFKYDTARREARKSR